ncbi:MAG: PAS domain-containing protein, partial [Calditrichaeota bacterium]|nr:PAS domain-containing protein [Calditrichota bacterium]
MTDLSREEFSSYSYSKYFDLAPVGYMTLDAAGTIVSTNSQIAAMLNADVEELVSSSFINFVSLEDQDKFLQFLTQLSDSGERATCEVDIPLDNVENIVLELHGIAVFDANG